MLNIARMFCRRGVLLKIYCHKMKNFKSVLLLFSPVNKTQHLHIVWKTEAVFQLFLSLNICCTILLSCGIDHTCIQ